MSREIELKTIDNNPAVFMYGTYVISMGAMNDKKKYIPIELNKDSAIKLRDFLNEFIEANNGK